MIPHPHNRLFWAAMERPAHAAALLRDLVPDSLGALIDWDTLHGETGSFIDPALAARHSDLVFSARLRTETESFAYAILEHQSTSDRTMPLRTLTYEVRIWNRICKMNPLAQLSPIVVVVVSHAPGGWTQARTLAELFDPAVPANAALARLVPDVPLIIDDLTQCSNEDLRRRTLPAFPKLALWLLRDARDRKRLLKNFDSWIDLFEEVEHGPDGHDAITSLIVYLFQVIDPRHHDELRAKLRLLGSRTKDIAMSIYDMLLQQGFANGEKMGRAKGRKEGRAEGRKKGHAEGHAEGQKEGRITALRRQVLFKFGGQTLAKRYEAALRRATPEAIDGYLQRVLTAKSVAAVFEG